MFIFINMNQELVWKTIKKQVYKKLIHGRALLVALDFCLIKNLAKKVLDHGLAPPIYLKVFQSI